MPCLYTSPLSPEQGRLTSRFGMRAGVQPPHLPTFHAGIDLGIRGAPVGTIPVFAVAPATVQVVGRNEEQRGPFNGYGNCIALKHVGIGTPDPAWTFYCHMDHFASDFVAGQTIAAGTRLGFVGNTTNGKFRGMGPHLHFEVRRATRAGASPLPGPYRMLNIDPVIWLAQIGVTFDRAQIVCTEPACAPRI